MKFTSREIALMGLLAATNGAIEITLGNYLHLVSFYFTGNIMIGFNCIVYMLGRKAIPKKGTILLISIVTSLLKFLFGWNINAAMAILMEGIIMELIIDLAGFNSTGVIFGSIMANIWALVHKIIFLMILGGGDFIKNIHSMLTKTTRAFLPELSLFTILIICISIYVFWGVIFGLLGWKIINKIYPEINNNKF